MLLKDDLSRPAQRTINLAQKAIQTGRDLVMLRLPLKRHFEFRRHIAKFGEAERAGRACFFMRQINKPLAISAFEGVKAD